MASTSQQQPTSPGGRRNRESFGLPGPGPAAAAGIGEDGKWFQALDERYLLPLFSNATASRTFHARKARRTASGGGGALRSTPGSGVGTPADTDDEDGEGDNGGDSGQELNIVDTSRVERGLPSPMLRSSGSLGDRIDRSSQQG